MSHKASPSQASPSRGAPSRGCGVPKLEPLSLKDSLAAARETRALEIGQAILGEVPRLFQQHFAPAIAVVVADTPTLAAAGETVIADLRSAGCETIAPFIFDDPDLYAEHRFVEQLEASFRQHDAIPVAVGSGTINDLVKLAAHRTGRPYLCVATAASMDGYTASGASITYQGSKQTFDCQAPRVVVADLDVIAAAPPEMLSWGYADLLAKVISGADWILADFLGIEAIEPRAWNIVQGGLRDAVGQPEALRSGDIAALAKLVEGLMLGGFAMQSIRSSRPASGGEHQFSHLWDMEHHTHNGHAPSHGQKVGIGTLAATGLYETLFAHASPPFDPAVAANQWPSLEAWKTRAGELFDDETLRQLAERELAAKHIDRDELLEQLTYLHENWIELRQRLKPQLIPLDQLRGMLSAVGAPIDSNSIGISPQRLAVSFHKAQMIRRRFTILDLAVRIGRMPNDAAE